MKQIGIIMMLLLSTLFVSAQQPDKVKIKEHQKSNQHSSIETRQAEELTQLTKQLTLSPEQQVSITTLQQNLNEATKAFRESKGDKADKKMKRQEMMKLREKYDTDIMGILTKKQATKYQAILKAREAEKQPQSSMQNSQGGSNEGGNEGGDDE